MKDDEIKIVIGKFNDGLKTAQGSFEKDKITLSYGLSNLFDLINIDTRDAVPLLIDRLKSDKVISDEPISKTTKTRIANSIKRLQPYIDDKNMTTVTGYVFQSSSIAELYRKNIITLFKILSNAQKTFSKKVCSETADKLNAFKSTIIDTAVSDATEVINEFKKIQQLPLIV